MFNTSVNSTQAQLARAEHLIEAGAHADAIAILGQISGRSHPAAVLAGRDYLLGRAQLESGRLDEALPLLAAAVQAQRSNAGYRIAYGVAAHMAGNLDEAEKQYREAMRLAPGAENPPLNLAKVLVDRGDWEGAIRAYHAVIARQPNAVLAMTALADIYMMRGELVEAGKQIDRALAIDPRDALAWNAYGKLSERGGDFTQAIEKYAKATECDPTLGDAWFRLGRVCGMSGDRERAEVAFARALALEPGNEKYRFMQKIYGTGDAHANATSAIERAPDSYVKELFDEFSYNFDQSLVDNLKYQVPQKMVLMLDPWLSQRHAAGHPVDALDLGCGTGLLGMAIGKQLGSLVGVDLSPKMLEHARSRGYSVLHEDEIGAFTRRQGDETFDLILSADVFLYIGDIDAILEAGKRILRKDGIFAFSVESLEDSDELPIRLRESARFAHRNDYIRGLADKHGYEWMADTAIEVRTEKGVPVNGRIYLLRKA